jgi:hypothetical protein
MRGTLDSYALVTTNRFSLCYVNKVCDTKTHSRCVAQESGKWKSTPSCDIVVSESELSRSLFKVNNVH